jgi:uncharacterized protein
MLVSSMLELWVLAVIVIAVGLVGTVVPGLPGMPRVLGGIALFAIGTSFSVVGYLQFGLLMLLGLFAMGLNLLGNVIGARKFGASRLGLLGAFIGLIPGLLLLGPFGVVIGPLAGAVVAELIGGRELKASLRSGAGVVVGYLFGSLAEVVIALVMVGWFLASTFGPVIGRGLGS